MRVLTYNICGHRAHREPGLLEEIAAVIRDSGADVVGLQEVYQASDPGADDQPERLAELTGMKACFWPHLYPRGGAYGNAILARGEIGRPALYRLPGWLLEPRALLYAPVEVDGRWLDFFCTHLVHFGPLMSRSRGDQVRELARRIAPHRRPRILVGDLNTGWGSRDLEALARAGLRSAGGDDLLTYPSHRPRRGLDHVFACGAWHCASIRTLRVTASDHLPLLAELHLAPAPAGERAVPVAGGA